MAQLMDAENNNVTTAVNASVIARSVNSSVADYSLLRSTLNTSTVSGLIKWYDVHSGKQQNEGVIFGVNVNENAVYWNSIVINVSSAGPPATIIPKMTAEIHNQTLPPGAPPVKLTFMLQDAGGNPIQSLAEVAVRVRVVPQGVIGRSAASILMESRRSDRHLLRSIALSATSCANASSTELLLEFVFTLNPSSSQHSVGPDFLCRVGTNDVFYDIGTVARGFFTATYPSAFQMSVAVFPGSFQSFMFIPYSNSSSVQTYTLVDFLEVVFLDLGLNEVNGNVTMSLVCTNRNVSLYPAKSFTVISNSSWKAVLPPFFLYVFDWMPLTAPHVTAVTANNSSVPQYGPDAAVFRLNQTCYPGYHVVKPSFDSLLMQLKTDVTNSVVTCAKCMIGTVSRLLDSWTCRSAHLCNVFFNSPMIFSVRVQQAPRPMKMQLAASHAPKTSTSPAFTKKFANHAHLASFHRSNATRA
jgi:hypothetical protein